ncbi:MAG: cytochrome c biogenesis protein CcsA, partial [Chloroflexi bacterium]|nr:cytochrome c biogenesis protein CcsA [Chloroflexota bacterium]
MLANFGYFALALALACAVYATLMALLGARRRKPAWLASAHHAALLTWPLITLASVCLIFLLVTEHYEIAFVSNVTSRAMPMYLKITAWWGGQAGSLVFWSWLMSTFAAAAMLRKWESDRALMPYVIVVSMITLGFFLGLVLFFENPFARQWATATGETVGAMLQPAGTLPIFPPDGRGLNPLLRHPGMIIHPPMLYTGFVSFVIPYAFAMAALITRRTDDEWIRTTRRWTLVGWLFLSLGLILGGRWAYDVLGWGGTYALVIFGTFLTRSGVLSSVHAFAQSAIGPAFFTFIGLTFIVSLSLLFREWDHLKSENQLDSLLSRESAFLLNNLLFIGIAASVFWGTVFPMISELATGQKISVGPPFYNRVAGPQFAALVLLMGIGPLMAWRKASPKQLGRMLLIPFVGAILVVGALLILGIRSWGALLGFGIV